MPPMKGLPPGGVVWNLDGNNAYVVYFVPGTNPPIPLAWHINDPKDMESVFGPGQQFSVDATISPERFAQMGGIKVGVLGDIENTEEDIFDGLATRFAREAQVKPYLKDPTVLASIAEAAAEGRQWDAESDLPLTDYWRNRTPGQREWDLLAASDPKAAQQRTASGTQKVRELLSTSGVVTGSDALTKALTQRWIQGEWTEQQLVDNVRRATDPYAPGATTFNELLGAGGQTAPDGWWGYFNGRAYLVTNGKHYQATGDGQVAGLERLYGPARQIQKVEQLGAGAGVTVEQFFGGAGGIEGFSTSRESGKPSGWHGVFNGKHYLVSNGKHYEASSPQGVADLERLYGAAANVGDVRHLGAQAGMTFEAMRTSGPGRTSFEELGDISIDPTALGGEERVRGLLKQWLGAYYAKNYDQKWIEQWAGRIRNGAEGEEEVLVEQLRNQAKALFGSSDAYEDRAAPWRGVWTRFAGVNPDEEKDTLFLRLLRPDMDAASAELLLRQEGNKREWEPVMDELLGGAQQALGSSVIGAGQ